MRRTTAVTVTSTVAVAAVAVADRCMAGLLKLAVGVNTTLPPTKLTGRPLRLARW
jgi:hypothetical protein